MASPTCQHQAQALMLQYQGMLYAIGTNLRFQHAAAQARALPGRKVRILDGQRRQVRAGAAGAQRLVRGRQFRRQNRGADAVAARGAQQTSHQHLRTRCCPGREDMASWPATSAST